MVTDLAKPLQLLIEKLRVNPYRTQSPTRVQNEFAQQAISVCVDITPDVEVSEEYWQSPFKPHREAAEVTDSASCSAGFIHRPNPRIDSELQSRPLQTVEKSTHNAIATPEKKITLFALRLAVLEKTASGLGALGFIWATVVLLGGFAVSLTAMDFWFVTIILLTEGTRIFSRSGELELQHEATWPICAPNTVSYRCSNKHIIAINPSSTAEKAAQSDQCEPISERSVTAKNLYHGIMRCIIRELCVVFFTFKSAGRLLCGFQVLSASLCVVLSLWRLIRQDYGYHDGEHNGRSASNIFYGLSLAEALLFLAERSYWYWKVRAGKLFVKVNEECGFDPSGLHTIRRFFYDTYSACVNDSVFDGLKMSLVSFGIDLLQSTGVSHGGRLSGARVLSAFVSNPRFAGDTLRVMGSTPNVEERLLEILNWKNPEDREVRTAAAKIIFKLVKQNWYRPRVGAIAGSLESIASLLNDGKFISGTLTEQNANEEPANLGCDYSFFNLLGLRILKNLAKDHDTCVKIGINRGLLEKIVGFTAVNDPPPNESMPTDSQMKTVKQSLQLLKMLAGTTGMTGKALRQEISKMVFTISNIRDILRKETETNVTLQTIAVETLGSLALDDEAREIIGSTGGLLQSLLSIFLMDINIDTDGNRQRKLLISQAGEALAILSVQNKSNCSRMIHLKFDRQKKPIHVIRNLLLVLNNAVRGVHAARILTNLCAYATSDSYVELRQVTAAAIQIIKVVMDEEEPSKLQEAALGLAAQIFKLMESSEVDGALKEAGISKGSMMEHLIKILEKHPRPSNKFPCIRRFTVELAICIIQKATADEGGVGIERLGLEAALKMVLNTTSDLENFSVFSGSVGLSKRSVGIRSLVQSAMAALHRNSLQENEDTIPKTKAM